MNHVGHNYFETMGIPIVRGRAFVEDDEREHSTTRKVAIVNESMAAKYWPGQDPIGKRFRVFNLRRAAARDRRRRARQQVRAGLRGAAAVHLSAARARPVAAHAARARRRRSGGARAAPRARDQGSGARPADRGSADDASVARRDLRLSDLPGRRDSGGRHGRARPDARHHRRVRRRLVRRQPAHAGDRHPRRARRAAARRAPTDSRPGPAARHRSALSSGSRPSLAMAACCRDSCRSSTPPTGSRSAASRPVSRRWRSGRATCPRAAPRACR